ncbi:MAG: MFS transporter [Planctomycetes bacterium]|nr:MFS transporter [Planctomycetota bacterium]
MAIDPDRPGDCCPPGARRDLRAMVWDGAFFSAMVGLGETYVPAFVLAAGLGAVAAGLIASFPLLVGAIVQLVTPWGVRQVGSYRRWVVACACLQVAAFAGLTSCAWSGEVAFLLVVLCSSGYWAAAMSASPPWNAWAGSLVPVSIRARYFARRSLVCQAVLCVAVLAGGLVLEHSRRAATPVEHAAGIVVPEVLVTFGWLFVVAGLARAVSASFIASQSEAPGLAATHEALSPRGVLRVIRDAGSGRVFVYLLTMQFGVYLSAPFFTPFMFGPLGLDFAEFTVLTTTAYVARVLALPHLGRWAQTRGTRAALWLGAVCTAPLPLLWLAFDDFWWLLAIQLFGGAAWASLELAMLLVFFDGIPDRHRTSVLSLYNFGNAVAIAVGATIAATIFTRLGAGTFAFTALFVLSAAARLATLAFLRGIRPARVTHAIELRTIAVRPSGGGAMQRPILATLDEAEPDGGNGSSETGTAPVGAVREGTG